MRHPTRLRVLLVGSILSSCLLAVVKPGEAAEEAWRFLNGLRERGYHDMALEYLERMRTSPHCPEDLKEQIDYEVGVTRIAGSGVVAGAQREEQFDQARDALQKFISEHPQHALAATANTHLANVMVERGRLNAEMAARPSKSAQEKAALMAQARKQYEEAQKVFAAAERRIYEKLKALETDEDSNDPKKVAEQDEDRKDLLQARLYLADVVYQIGETYEPNSKEFKDHLTEAAKKYNAFYEKYKERTAGLYARLQEGRTYKELGDTEKAIPILQEMLAVSGADDTGRMLRNQSLGLLLEAYLLPNVKKHAEAVAEAKKWQEGTRGSEESSPDGLKILFLAGKAALAMAEAMKADDPQRRVSLKAARQHFEFVARFRDEFQRDARDMLAHKLLGGVVDTGEPEVFDDAKERGDFAWGSMIIAYGKLQQATNNEEKAQHEKEMNRARDECLTYYHTALGLKTSETPLPQVNAIRSYLTQLYWFDEDYYSAAVVGEFLARRYPQSAGSSPAAEIAVKAYRMLYALSPKRKEERTFETRRMTEVANLIATRWPGEPVTDEAWMVLLDTAVDNRDLEKTEEYLAKINPDSPKRAQAELRAGQMLWASYVQESNKPEGERPSQEKLDELSTKAKATLEQGVARMRKSVDEGGGVDYPLVYSVLSLAQIYTGGGQSEQAAEWLDDPKVGPMTLVTAKHPATDKENFHVETYKAALRAYVGAQELDKAEKAMDALEALVVTGGDAAAARKLTEIYIVLGRQLQETLKRLRQENKNEEAEQVASGFELFLDRISARGTGNTFNSLNWVAETYFNLGAGLDPEGQETPEKAKLYYQRAAQTYLKTLTTIKEDAGGEFAPAGAAANIQVRLAKCLRALDKHSSAMQILVRILRERDTRVDVQIEAARTYQDWGRIKSGYYAFAIKGGIREGNRNLVWGWGGIARRVAPYPKYQGTFHEAQYNLALCRMKLAEKQQGAEKKKTLAMAERDITSTHMLHPNMGGDEQYEKYDALLKIIQRLRGNKRPPGLSGRSQNATPSTAGSRASASK